MADSESQVASPAVGIEQEMSQVASPAVGTDQELSQAAAPPAGTEQEMIDQLMREKELLNQQNKDLKKKVKDMQKVKLREQVDRDVKDKTTKAEHANEIQKHLVIFRDLKQRLPKINRLNLTKSDKVAFWEQTAVRYIQYPDNETLEQMTNQEIQPIRLGLFGGYQQYTLIAQFGSLPEFRTGSNQDHEQLKVQCIVDQYKIESRVSKIVYEREKMFPFYERFRFISKEVKDKSGKNVLVTPQELGCMGKPYQNSQNDIRTQEAIVVNKKHTGLGAPPEDEFLVAIRVGMNKYGGIADMQFIYHKRT